MKTSQEELQKKKQEQQFTSNDGRRLQELQEEMIPLKRTALGVAAKQNAKAVVMHLEMLDDDDKQELLRALTDDQAKRRGQPKDDNNYGVL
jgi:hypothetical protein